jgi:hypothetical protein
VFDFACSAVECRVLQGPIRHPLRPIPFIPRLLQAVFGKPGAVPHDARREERLHVRGYGEGGGGIGGGCLAVDAKAGSGMASITQPSSYNVYLALS